MNSFALSTTLLTLAVSFAVPIAAQVISPADPVALPQLEIWGRTDVFRQQDTPSADGGEYLGRLSGLSGSRMGGHGTDILIRGQKDERNTVLLDGAAIQGGCPNHMDPATSYAPVEFYDSVRVLKGPQTLIYGPGGTGGTVLFERSVKRFESGERARLSLDTGYTDNADSWFVSVDAAAGTEDWQARILGTTRSADDYVDGDGNEVRSAYRQDGLSFIGAYTPQAETRIEIGAEHTRALDVLFAGAAMDSPESTSDIFRLRLRHQPTGGAVRAIEFDSGYAEVAHTMDNYSLRPAGMMWMFVPSETAAWTARLNTRIEAGPGEIQTGFNFQQIQADATRYSGPAGTIPTTVNSYMWPEVERQTVGVFTEYQFSPDPDSNLLFGLRGDRFDASAGTTDLDPPGMMMSPNRLYQMYYGSSAQRDPVIGLGALLRYERRIGDKGFKAYAAAQRSLRDADTTERFIGTNNSAPAMRWVGNPGLELETHNLAEAGLLYESAKWLIAGSIHGDWVSDFILRDRAHGQTATGIADNASIYRNVDARLIGFELEVSHSLTGNLQANARLAYVEGTNTTEDRPLAQIPPLEGAVGLDYVTEIFRVGAMLRFADAQDRVDDNPMTGSGLDAGPTPGWATLDLEGRYRVTEQIEVRGGVRNLFDETYAIHVNRSNDFDATQAQINEPGRTLWIALNLSY
ncbi:MAG: TonB-dependent copper receptor [Opitutaceae bacterium]